MRGPEHRKNGLLDAVGQLCDDRHGVKPKRSTPEAFAETVRTDLDKWSKVAKEAKEANIRRTSVPRYSVLTLRSSISLRHKGISVVMIACSSAGVEALASTP